MPQSSPKTTGNRNYSPENKTTESHTELAQEKEALITKACPPPPKQNQRLPAAASRNVPLACTYRPPPLPPHPRCTQLVHRHRHTSTDETANARASPAIAQRATAACTLYIHTHTHDVRVYRPGSGNVSADDGLLVLVERPVGRVPSPPVGGTEKDGTAYSVVQRDSIYVCARARGF